MWRDPWNLLSTEFTLKLPRVLPGAPLLSQESTVEAGGVGSGLGDAVIRGLTGDVCRIPWIAFNRSEHRDTV